MYVEKFNNNGTPYLRLVESKRIPNKDGIKMPKKTVVFNIGPLSRFDDGEPDYLQRLRILSRQVVPSFLPCSHTQTDRELRRRK